MKQIPAKERILNAARRQFAVTGFRATTLRAIAAEAECDVALIPHYFGSKERLFRAAIEFPVEVETVMTQVTNTPFEQLGETMLRDVLAVWDSPLLDPIMAAFKRQIDSPQLISDFVNNALWKGIRTRLEDLGLEKDVLEKRIGLAQTQLIGLLAGRYLLRLPGLVEQNREEIVQAMAPILQGILNGDHHG